MALCGDMTVRVRLEHPKLGASEITRPDDRRSDRANTLSFAKSDGGGGCLGAMREQPKRGASSKPKGMASSQFND